MKLFIGLLLLFGGADLFLKFKLIELLIDKAELKNAEKEDEE